MNLDNLKQSLPRFGRYTVAALEAKIQQYEREVDHLKRALERSDQYIEDLESRLRKAKNGPLDAPERHTSSEADTDALTQQQKISMMMRSLSDSERVSICSNPEAEYQTFSKNSTFICLPGANHRDFSRDAAEPKKKDDPECAPSDFPTTPSSAFRSLTLRSPGIRDKKVAFKPGSYHRKLNFEDFPSPDKSAMEERFTGLDPLPNGFPLNPDKGSSKSVVWGPWQSSVSDEPGPSAENSGEGSPLRNVNSAKFEMSSEASMDAAYLDKISELDSMMLDVESCSSRGSQLSLASSPRTGLDSTLVPEPQACPDVQSSRPQADDADDPPVVKKAPEASADVSATLDSVGGSSAPSPASTDHQDELSFDLLFDSLEDNKAGLASLCNQESQDHRAGNPAASSGWSSDPANTTKERHVLSISQPTKRKSHGLCSVSSPTKLSKLM